jgi:3-isopropylmalate/(R)-2-methylmalate dehydratase small subunit
MEGRRVGYVGILQAEACSYKEEMVLKGFVHKFGDDVNTDEIIPAQYLNTTDAVTLGKYCMEGAKRGFSSQIKRGDIIVAGKNFGCGSSREHAPLAIKGCGILCVIARDFARIFFRNAINIGLPILESPEAAAELKDSDEIEIDLKNGQIKNILIGKIYKTQPFPEFMQELMDAGGLMGWIRLAKNKRRKSCIK